MTREQLADPGADDRVIMHSRHTQDGEYLAVSDGCRDLIGYEPDELVGTSAYALFHPEDLGIIASSHARVLGMPDTTTVTYRIRHRDGSYRWVTSVSVQRRDAVGAVVEIDSVTTPERDPQTPSDVVDGDGHHELLIGRASSMVAVLDTDGARILHASPMLERTVGSPPVPLVGVSFFELIAPPSLARVVGHLSGLLHRPRATTTFFCDLRTQSGELVPVSMVIQDLAGDPLVGGLLVVAHEVHASEPATHDRDHAAQPPPGLLDRAMLHRRLSELLQGPPALRDGLSLVMVQLGELETVAAGLGSHAASTVLGQALHRLTAEVRGMACSGFAQLGVGHLAVAVHGLADLGHARTLGERLRDVLGLPYQLSDDEVFIAPRVVVGASGAGVTAEGLLTASHHAIGQTSPGTRVVAFEATRGDEARQRLQLRSDLHHAIERDELVLHYQPCVNLADGTIFGAEALIRWQHPARGLLFPAEFVPMAEDSDFIVPLGIWVLQAACRQLARWISPESGEGPCVAVNVSTHQLLDGRFPEAVADTLAVSRVPADRLCLEITETAVLESDGRTQAALDQLVELGVRLAIDDFGAGHANLSYLKRLPAHNIKIDRSFIAGLDDDDPNDIAIVAGTTAMAHALGRSVTAEGIETATQLAAVRSLGCDHAQGYLFSRPVPPDDFETMLMSSTVR